MTIALCQIGEITEGPKPTIPPTDNATPACTECASGRFAARSVQLVRAVDRLAGAEVGPDVVREERQHLVRHLPFRLGQPLLHEAIDGDADQLEDGLQRQVKFVEDGFSRLQETHHLGHELVHHTLDLAARRGGRVPAFQLDQPLDVGPAEGGNLLPKLTDVVEAIRANGRAPTTARFGIADGAAAIPAIVGVRHQAALQMTAGPDRAQRSVRDIQRDHLRRLVRWTLDKTGRKRLRIGTFVRGSGFMSLSRPPRPDRDRLRPVADALIHKEILEVGAHRPVADAKALRDLFIGKPGGGQVENLRLTWRYARPTTTP